MREVEMCIECLERRIKEDFSDRLIFSYGLTDYSSSLPFASSAIVQVPDSSSGEVSASAPQFLVNYLHSDDHACLANYVNECILENIDGSTSNDLHSPHDSAKPSTDNATSTHVLVNGKTTTPLDVTNDKTSSCNHSGWFSCHRIITALAPIAQIGISSYSTFEDLASSYLSGSLEDHVLCSLSLMIEGKASGRESVNFLRLVGVPSFDENCIPGCLRHPNLAPVLGLLKASSSINLVIPKTPHTLEDILHYSPNALPSDWHKRFLVYQLLSALAHLHGLGVSQGNICPSSIMLSDSCWSWLQVCDKPQLGFDIVSEDGPTSSRSGCHMECCFLKGPYTEFKLSPSLDWHSQFDRWWKGDLSNFEYLIFLNGLAGRRWGDHTFHPVMPWVIDFSVKPDERSDSGWRDLSKSKWRLAKGDEQLDFTYSTSEIPHHVSDECLSELAVCSYKARRLPLSVLRTAVRSVYEPNEYPSNMQRLYQWTPDECIPEFYCDPQVFYSIHSGMTHLAVPSWAGTPEEFIKLHRDALESNRVSCQIHHWIDITFGYKMSGQAAVDAKNVMLPSSEPTKPRSVGRRQLFTQPHPARRCATQKIYNHITDSSNQSQVNGGGKSSPILETSNLVELEAASAFSEHARHLSPLYCHHKGNKVNHISSLEVQTNEQSIKNISKSHRIGNGHGLPPHIDLTYLLETIEAEDRESVGYQELLLWKQKSSISRTSSEDIANDIFSLGCVLAELYLRRPLFDSVSLTTYLDNGSLPGLFQELPPHAKVLVEACIQKDWTRRPSAKFLLESPFFLASVISSYLFVAPLQLIAKDGSRLLYAANFAKHGVLRAMGTFAAEMCAPYCLPLVVAPMSDDEAEYAYVVLKEFIKCLTEKAVRTLILPAVQKILQTTGYSHLKVSLLQDSFVREIWNRIGKQVYLETIHPLVISNLYMAPHKSSTAAASVLLIGSSEELGVPITVHQTIFPLIHCFGKGLCSDGIDVLIRIGNLLGETFVISQMLPLLKNVVRSCIDTSLTKKPEPVQSWSALALIDCLMTLEGLAALLPKDVVVKELIQDQSCIPVMVIMQTNLEFPVLQAAASTLMVICQHIGPDLTVLHVLPQLNELFGELAFSQETANVSGSLGESVKASKPKVDGELQIECRMDLALLLYPSFASLLGIEKLRKGCATWLILEQFLLRSHNWKLEESTGGESSRTGAENIIAKRLPLNKRSTSEYNPTKLLLNGVGWSIPQSQGIRGSKGFVPQRRFYDIHKSNIERHEATSNFMKREPWFWFPSPAANWDGPGFLGRVGGLKDEVPWKIKASVISSIRAHHGALRSLAVCEDESTVFTAGIGAGFKGTVQKWDLTRINCVTGYYGHEEVVNDICVLSSSGRMASCDGTIHVWNSQNGKLMSIFGETSDSAHLASSLSSVLRSGSDQECTLTSNPLSSGILASAFDGRLYTCMHHLNFMDKLVVGTGNGSLRFIDVDRGQKLHYWKGDSVESGLPSIVSAISSCGSDKMVADGTVASPSWIATALSSGQCRLFDVRSGNVISSWKAHDGFITKLAAPEDHLLVSSSLDKTLRIWDLRRNWQSQPVVFKGHRDGISGFSVWGQDVISISKNKIGLSSLSRNIDEDGHNQIIPQKLYMSDTGARNLSVLSSISILPFSRLFLVGTEDGYLRICC
ncbi:hypothetical protein ACFE04_006504 [Oxalis oulophora]